ncbi:MAG: class I SAM-dependent methyltransferase [Alphaproteobacteria bacterium]|nr:MAG: class I SAM-dependent methyltransferase [Alphaproteobacteria bacterium]
MLAKFKSGVAYKTFRRWNKSLRRRFDLLSYLGRACRCPVCLTGLRAFKPARGGFPDELARHGFVHPASAFETFNLEAVSCPACDATDRERLTALYLVEMFRTFDPRRRYRLIEFAPGAGLPVLFRRYPFVGYRSADLYRADVDDRVDITDMRIYADQSVDVLLCSHVLEHVPEDRKAMSELHRILKSSGFGIVLVPLVTGVDETHEDPAIDTPALRWKHYGLDDHVRQYGRRDFVDRLTGAGFTVDQLGIDHFGAAAFREAGITEKSVLYVVRRSTG